MQKDRKLQTLVFSTKGAVGATIIAVVLMMMAIMVATRVGLSQSVPNAALASAAIVAAGMVWLRNRHAIYAWACVATLSAAMLSAATLLLADHGGHDIFYRAKNGGYVLIMLAIACWLFKIGRRSDP